MSLAGRAGHLRCRPSRKISLLSLRVALGLCQATFVKSRRSSAANSCVPAHQAGPGAGQAGSTAMVGPCCECQLHVAALSNRVNAPSHLPLAAAS